MILNDFQVYSSRAGQQSTRAAAGNANDKRERRQVVEAWKACRHDVYFIESYHSEEVDVIDVTDYQSNIKMCIFHIDQSDLANDMR